MIVNIYKVKLDCYSPKMAEFKAAQTLSLCTGSNCQPTGLDQGLEYANRLKASWGKKQNCIKNQKPDEIYEIKKKLYIFLMSNVMKWIKIGFLLRTRLDFEIKLLLLAKSIIIVCSPKCYWSTA